MEQNMKPVSLLFPSLAFAIGVLTSSLRVGNRSISSWYLLVVFDRGCGWNWLGVGEWRGVLVAVLDCGCGWKVLPRVSPGVLRGMWLGSVAATWCGTYGWEVLHGVNVTFGAETCKRDLCEHLRFGDLVGELHVVDVYLTFLSRIHAIWCLCWIF